jgi:hypothetical protein
MEPNPFFAVLLDNDDKQASVKLSRDGISQGGYNEGVVVAGQKCNAWAIAPIGGAITPKHPLQITVESKNGDAIVLRGVMHKSSGDQYTVIPPGNAF